jgi:hypothetical protein
VQRLSGRASSSGQGQAVSSSFPEGISIRNAGTVLTPCGLANVIGFELEAHVERMGNLADAEHLL